MPSKVYSASIYGLEGHIIEVEVDVTYGLRNFSIVGMADKAIGESRERIGSAIKSSGYKSPHHQPQRVLVNLAPADLKKEGTFYDLPIALAYLLESKQISFSAYKKLFLGELSLDGNLRPIKGALSLASKAIEEGYSEIILPKENYAEASLALKFSKNKKTKIIGAVSLKETIDYLYKGKKIKNDGNFNFDENKEEYLDISWIKGQESAKRALEIAAAGNHNLFMQGPPGTGKSMLAKTLPSILPPLSDEEMLEVVKIYSISGELNNKRPYILARPFRSPHHSASESALIGGGNPVRPGEITLAHRGVLFLDEFPEFHRDVIESLRQIIEDGRVSILRAKEKISFPSKFMLIVASNPCPCGNYNNPLKPCVCLHSRVTKYRQKLSGPMMDRLDLFIEVPQINFEKLSSQNTNNKESTKIREKIAKAREIQKERFKRLDILYNCEMRVPEIEKYCQLDSQSKTLISRFVDSGKLSGRGYHRVLKTARTIADLDNEENILGNHLSEALSYRFKS